jgi:hypothetical protein
MAQKCTQDVLFATLTGWPDWANFRPFGNCFLLAVFENFRSRSNFLATTLYRKTYELIFAKMRLATFGRFL